MPMVLDNDGCGVREDCYTDGCPCYLLGRHGRRLDIYSTDETGWLLYHVRDMPPGQRSRFSSLEDAVKADQSYLASILTGKPM